MWFLKLILIVLSVLMIKYRERIGEQLGDQYWMRYVGGVYNFVILLAVLIFLWALASLTGTVHILFAPLFWFFGGAFR